MNTCQHGLRVMHSREACTGPATLYPSSQQYPTAVRGTLRYCDLGLRLESSQQFRVYVSKLLGVPDTFPYIWFLYRFDSSSIDSGGGGDYHGVDCRTQPCTGGVWANMTESLGFGWRAWVLNGTVTSEHPQA